MFDAMGERRLPHEHSMAPNRRRSTVLVTVLRLAGDLLGFQLGWRQCRLRKRWNYTTSTTGASYPCLGRSNPPVSPTSGIPYTGSRTGANVQYPLPMPQPQRCCRGYLPGGSSRQCSSSATCHSTSMVSKYSRASADRGIRKTGCNLGSPATMPRRYCSIKRAADFIAGH